MSEGISLFSLVLGPPPCHVKKKNNIKKDEVQEQQNGGWGMWYAFIPTPRCHLLPPELL